MLTDRKGDYIVNYLSPRISSKSVYYVIHKDALARARLSGDDECMIIASLELFQMCAEPFTSVGLSSSVCAYTTRHEDFKGPIVWCKPLAKSPNAHARRCGMRCIRSWTRRIMSASTYPGEVRILSKQRPILLP